MFEANSELTVFQLLEDACLSLMEVRSSRSHDQPHRNLYCRMMWSECMCVCVRVCLCVFSTVCVCVSL